MAPGQAQQRCSVDAIMTTVGSSIVVMAHGGMPAASSCGGRLVRIVKRKLKKIQYRPHLIDGCLAATGLKIEPW